MMDLAIRVVSQVSVESITKHIFSTLRHTQHKVQLCMALQNSNQYTRAHETTESVVWHTRAAAR